MVLVAAGTVRRRRATDDRASSPSASARCVQCSWRGRLPPSRSPARYAALSNAVGAAKASGLIALARTDARLGRVGSRRWRRRGAACCCIIPCHGAAAAPEQARASAVKVRVWYAARGAPDRRVPRGLVLTATQSYEKVARREVTGSRRGASYGHAPGPRSPGRRDVPTIRPS